MSDLFISYARQDSEAAEAVAKALEDRGLSVWWDRRIQGGAEFSADIERALAGARAVLVLWSKDAASSPWVRDEAAAGRDEGKLIPLSIDGSIPPMGFRQYQTIALRDWLGSGGTALPRELDEAIAAKLNGAGSDAAAAEDRSGAPAEQEVRFCTAPDGVGLAYSVIGDGPPLVKAANWLNHLEFERELPVWRDWIKELSLGRRLLRYDERGNGMSDWKAADLSFEAFVQDLETVVDAAGFDRFDLIGLSQGAPVAIAFANRHPERVRKLVLFAGFAAGWSKFGDSEIAQVWDAMVKLTGIGWGKDNATFRQMFTSQCFPDATPEEAKLFNELQRVSASPENAQKLMLTIGSIDVRKLLPDVRVPTLVMHCRNDAFVPFDAGRRIASRIPSARFVPLESANHIPSARDRVWPKFQQHLRSFLAD